MIILHQLLNNKSVVQEPDEISDFSATEIEVLKSMDNQDRPLDFRMISDTNKLMQLEGSLNTQKRIYKSGFLHSFYKILYPNRKSRDLYEMINDKYDLFINQRQFQRDVKAYNEKKLFIFAK